MNLYHCHPVSLAAYFFKRNFFQRPQNKRHCVSCRHVVTCLEDMSRKHVTSEGSHFFVLSRHYFGLKEYLGTSSLSQRWARRCRLTTSIEPCNSLTNVSFSHLCIATSICGDCTGASQRVRTDPESNLRTSFRKAGVLTSYSNRSVWVPSVRVFCSQHYSFHDNFKKCRGQKSCCD